MLYGGGAVTDDAVVADLPTTPTDDPAAASSAIHFDVLAIILAKYCWTNDSLHPELAHCNITRKRRAKGGEGGKRG